MSRDLILKKCKSCGAIVKIVKDCTCDDCGIRCCGEQMIRIMPNSSDASFEKHIPEYEIVGDKIIVKVNHVMEEEHYIEWISMVSDKEEDIIYFKEGDIAKAEFKYIPGSILYSYCNKHELWKKEVE